MLFLKRDAGVVTILVGSSLYRGRVVEWHGDRGVTIDYSGQRVRGRMVPLASEPAYESMDGVPWE